MEFKDFWSLEAHVEAEKKKEEFRKKKEARDPPQMVIIHYSRQGISDDEYFEIRNKFEDEINETRNRMYFNGYEEALDGGDGRWYIDLHRVDKTFKKHIKPKLEKISFMKGAKITFRYNVYDETEPDKEIKEKSFILEEFDE